MNDFLFDETGDLKEENGDLVIGNSEEQHQFDIVKSGKAHNKEFPGMGVDVEEHLNDENIGSLVNEVRKNFVADGMKVKAVTLIKGNLETDASY